MKVKYDNHPQEWEDILRDPVLRSRAETCFESDRVDSWRHARIHAPLLPIIAHSKNKSWVTIGDGRYGTDAHFLLEQGVINVHATDIVDTMLQIGAEKGFIKSYSVQNAEHIDFGDEHFDLVYCKEAYHHFPRPYVALYEMLRICRVGVVLTEPNDLALRTTFRSLAMRRIERSAKRLLGMREADYIFEPVGNFAYTLSEWEIRKLMLGVGLRYCAFKGVNDHYIDGVQYIPLSGGSLNHRWVRFKIKAIVLARDLLCRLGLSKPSLLTAVIFKTKPDAEIWQALQRDGFKLEVLPKNPYV
jgi:ubiquinone/menaquinone biosynthesis C-methylase UbiE